MNDLPGDVTHPTNATDARDATDAADATNATDAADAADATQATDATARQAAAADDALILPPLTGEEPKRLLVMLHGAGSSAGAVVAAALAWQLKLRSAQALLLQAPFSNLQGRRYWTDPAVFPVRAAAIAAAADGARRVIAERQGSLGVGPEHTLLVGFSQGASVALELSFGTSPCAGITIAYAARLYRLPRAGDRVLGHIHLLHGGADSVVPSVYGERAYRRLRAMGARVSLDLLPEEGHAVGQMLINRGTQHAMNWLFDRQAQAPAEGTTH